MVKYHISKLFRIYRDRKLQLAIYQAAISASRGNIKISESFALPCRYGQGLPERVIELLFAALIYRPDSLILDVGHANIMLCHKLLLLNLPNPRLITGIDIVKPIYNHSKYYSESLIKSIVDTGLPSNYFDQIWCISALEHFGMDNSNYSSAIEQDSSADSKALVEMLRIIKPGGKLLISVPFGKFEDHGWLKNYDRDSWQSLLDIARKGGVKVKEYYFRHTFGNGWRIARIDELQFVGYFDQANCGCGALAVALIEK
jgi:SAM-dependent methyltransferase